MSHKVEKFVEEIKEKRCIWDINDDKYGNEIAVNAAWLEVAATTGKPADKCKAAWSCLQDPKRCHFAKLLSFLPNVQKRKTKCHDFNNNFFENDSHSDNTIGQLRMLELDYSSESGNKTNFKQLKIEPLNVGLASQNDFCESKDKNLDFLEDSTKSHDTILPDKPFALKCNTSTHIKSQAVRPVTPQDLEINLQKPHHQNQITLKHYEKYLYIDSMLKKLPEDVVEELTFNFMCQIRTMWKTIQLKEQN